MLNVQKALSNGWTLDDHITYAHEIGINFQGRPGPKCTAHTLACEVERLRGILKVIHETPYHIECSHAPDCLCHKCLAGRGL